MNDVQSEFKRWQRDGFLGDPNGSDAYGYSRASSERQVEEGSSFPRQIEHIHKAALRDGLRIPFELLFFDDGFTGFEFEHRPALIKLRHEIATKPRAVHLVIEDIDRLSRNADWQQGYLLEELSRHRIAVHFFISPGSQLERYVRGYIAQEGMKKDIERMRMGNLYKAMDGRVTARKRKFGYLKTHPVDSHYELHPEESKIMRAIYEKVIYERWTLHQIARWLNDAKVPTRSRTGHWMPATLLQLIKSPVYKGEFYANVIYQFKTGMFNDKGRPKRSNRKRPPEEWIKVEVPAIVTPEEWEQAIEILKGNRKISLRNGVRGRWLLQGLCKCAVCKTYTLLAITGGSPNKPIRYYGCNGRFSEKARVTDNTCQTPYVHADELEQKVWEKIETVVYDPSSLLQRLEDKAHESRQMGLAGQIEYIGQQLAGLARERAKLEAAYARDIYTLDEFAEKMEDNRARVQALEISQAKLRAKQSEIHSLEEQKKVVLAGLNRMRAELETARQDRRLPEEIPFELKRRLLGLLVDTIWVDTEQRTFTIEGEIKGTYAIDDPGSEGKNAGFVLASSPIWPRCGTCRLR